MAGNNPNIEARPRQAYLDSIRGVACLLVVFHHLNVNAGIHPFTVWGFTGVHVFFVLSGYLLCRPYLKALSGRQSFPETLPFYLRRFIRIYPPYFVALIIYIGLRGVTHTKMPTTANIALHTSLLFNYGPPEYFFAINPAFWSLAIEIQFYIALPIVAWVVFLIMRNKLGSPANFLFVAAFYFIGIISRAGEFLLTHQASPHPAENILYFRILPSYLDLFGAGVLVAVLESIPTVTAKLRRRYVSGTLFCTGLICFLSANVWCSRVSSGAWLTVNDFWFSVVFPLLLCLSIALMMVPIVQTWGEQSKWLNSWPMVTVGAISYSIYLYHIGIQFFILKTIHLDSIVRDYALRNFVFSLISFVPVIAISALMYWIIERPCLNYLSRAKISLKVANPSQVLSAAATDSVKEPAP